jgi:serine/threonine protein kinase
VALKVVRPDIVRQDPAMIERLKSEIKLARRISHRNVVRAHDLGEFKGTYFITMEYVRGITVAELLDRRGRLSVASTVAIGIQLADALAMAHDAQIVHRDVKPANLLVDEDGVLKVMDFGIAVFAERPDAITMSGFVVGTPEYMAPEQLVGGTITARTDLFSAGVVLYECLSGAPPFRAESPVALLAQLSQRNVLRLRQRVSGVPEALDGIVMQMLEFQPADRPASARAIVDQLSEIEHTADDESEPDPIIAPIDLDFSQ